MSEERKKSGYVYSVGTKTGFARMKRRGIVLPPFSIEDDVTKLLTTHYTRLMLTIAEAGREYEKHLGRGIKDEAGIDPLFWSFVKHHLPEVFMVIGTGYLVDMLGQQLGDLISQSIRHFFTDFLDDADDQTKVRVAYALDNNPIFQKTIEDLKLRYLETSLERITWEQDALKKSFLKRMTAWMQGETPSKGGVNELVEVMRKTSVHEARFFARDQFAKLNQSLTLASIEEAGADKVEWLTVQDQRVRPSHKKLHGKIFTVEEVNDMLTLNYKNFYNCRCGFIPVWE